MFRNARCAGLVCLAALSGGLAAHAGDSDGRSYPEALLPNLCFAPGTPAEVVERANLEMRAAIEAGDTGLPSSDEALRFNTRSSWVTGAGQPVELTWSLVPDGTLVSDRAGNVVLESRLFATLDTAYLPYGGRATWIAQIQESFDRWAELTGLTFRRVSLSGQPWDDGEPQSFSLGDQSPARGQIRISMATIDGPGGVLAFNYFPGSGGDMVIDIAEGWQSPSNSFRFFRNVVMHEIGHGLGVSHVCSGAGSFLMEPRLNTSFDGAQHDDVRAVQWLYGDPYEPNQSAGGAPDVGVLSIGDEIMLGELPPPSVAGSTSLSLRDFNDQDWFSLRVVDDSRISVRFEPIGLVYDDGDQRSDGSCGTGLTIDTSSGADVELALLDETGSEVLAVVGAGGEGDAEEIQGVFVDARSRLSVRVRSTASTTAQHYRLVISADAGSCRADRTATGASTAGFPGFGEADGVVNLDDLGFFLNLWLVQDPAADETTTGATNPVLAGFGVPDGNVDLDDLAVFLLYWLSGCN